MYRVMIVDDEPPLIRSLKRAVEKNSPFFEVVADALNGSEALEKISKVRPDVVFTDIKMPVIDGISLVTRLSREYPDIYPVIVSGYQDFDYARAALKARVVDYLVKPVDSPAVFGLLTELKEKLDTLYNIRRIELLQKAVNAQPIEDMQVQRYLNFDLFTVLLIKKGASASRKSSTVHYENDKIACLLDINLLISRFGIDDIILVDGKDENEAILFICNKKALHIDIVAIAKSIGDMLSGAGSPQFFTTVYMPVYVESKQIHEAVDTMYKVVNHKLIIGKTQLLDASSSISYTDMEPPLLGDNLVKKFSVLFQNKSTDLLRDELTKLLLVWEKAAYPQTYVEKLLKQIMQNFEKHSPCVTVTTSLTLDQQIEEVLSLSTDFSGILRGVWDIVEDLLGTARHQTDKSEDLINRIDLYIKNNLSESLSLQRVCDMFGLSQPFLSRLFRKNREMSFNEYVTYVKIAEAKRLISEQPEILMKDIAEIVGYQDQHYFSRVFKSITGISPTEFRK